MCTLRVIEQWEPLKLFFTAQVFEEHSSTAERVLTALKSPFVKATFEFMNFVLDELTGLNRLFQSDSFKLHTLYPEVLRVIKMFAMNFIKRSSIKENQLHMLNVDDSSCWVSPELVYPGLGASETIKQLLPHQKESFLERCRDWYREAIKQLQQRIDLNSPVLKALPKLNPLAILAQTAEIFAVAVLSNGLPSALLASLELLSSLIDSGDRFWLTMPSYLEGGKT